jgi:hypothetical protein
MNAEELLEKYIMQMPIKPLLTEVLMKNLIEHDPELVRYAVNRIKRLACLKIPNYELPSDHFIEEAIKDILNYVEIKTKEKEGFWRD